MHITEVDHGLTLAAPAEGYVRSPGLHASNIYNALYADLEPARYTSDSGPDLTKMEVGTSFEEVLEPVLARRVLGERPGEFRTQEGIIYSPDYLFFDGETVLGEFKLTWYSSRGAPTDKKFDKWLTQIKFYCRNLGVTKARLFVLFVNGDYRPPSPQLRAWDLEFNQKELEECHKMLVRYAKQKGML